MNKMKILVVEDDISVKNLIVTTLQAHGYQYLSAKDGQEAILEASSHNPDVILLDLGLPDVDGVEIIKRCVPGPICRSSLSVREVKTAIRLKRWMPGLMII